MRGIPPGGDWVPATSAAYALTAGREVRSRLLRRSAHSRPAVRKWFWIGRGVEGQICDPTVTPTPPNPL